MSEPFLIVTRDIGEEQDDFAHKMVLMAIRLTITLNHKIRVETKKDIAEFYRVENGE